ncbi:MULTISPECIES: DUF2069 domain-containing protein [Stenotrophomonas]|uniref:DUF2069 domain-containing protein n=1 Tax=Stenotrophomonas TaxID=40323 RepID=UPI00201CF9CD|nr:MULTISPECIES: DUF2069 domain-containing protein [Stenotrophomonas]MBN5026829.1 DUF2069 domain-containing protein [Stenotrophomonas maltophilia]MDH1273867.1 DUF2069 domain-containing protein [Stenotrophomonas sp. GD03937]MDH1485555.1 DUF2069 domain-containing protein [Stenotrophomonas sp. GD03712]UQY93867.1 DUF2069 domain-containing protein [Stenotrophomonas maltophilia]WON69453.1 DUF2069 domain-containing protein [Stenotrophomonas maltophilia]
MSTAPRTVLLLALMGLAALFAGWFINDKHWLATQLVFTAPPLLLAVAVRLGWRKAGFWASVLALGWFSHGVMSTWSHPETRWLALIEIALALLVIFSASLPGLRARFGKRR